MTITAMVITHLALTLLSASSPNTTLPLSTCQTTHPISAPMATAVTRTRLTILQDGTLGVPFLRPTNYIALLDSERVVVSPDFYSDE